MFIQGSIYVLSFLVVATLYGIRTRRFKCLFCFDGILVCYGRAVHGVKGGLTLYATVVLCV